MFLTGIVSKIAAWINHYLFHGDELCLIRVARFKKLLNLTGQVIKLNRMEIIIERKSEIDEQVGQIRAVCKEIIVSIDQSIAKSIMNMESLSDINAYDPIHAILHRWHLGVQISIRKIHTALLRHRRDKVEKQEKDAKRFEDGKSDKEILDNLLLSTRYDKRLLPPVQECNGRRDGTEMERTLTVNVSVLLLSLASPDESSLKYEVEFLLQQQWYDPRLRYSNRSQYEFLNAIHHYDDIWLPDTYFIMHGDFKDPLIPVHFALLSYEQTAITYVWKNDEGTLRKSPSLTSLNAYLIKNQTITCPIKVSWRENLSREDDGENRMRNEKIILRSSRKLHIGNLGSCLALQPSPPWFAFGVRSQFFFSDLKKKRGRKIVGCSVAAEGQIMVDYEDEFDEFGDSKCSLCQRRFEEQEKEKLKKKGRGEMHLLFAEENFHHPISGEFSFGGWKKRKGEEIKTIVFAGVTTMLNFFTTSNGFRSTLPVVSNLTAMNVWDGVCMCFIYASLLEFVCVNYVGRKRPMHNVVYRPGENPVTQDIKPHDSRESRHAKNTRNSRAITITTTIIKITATTVITVKLSLFVNKI
ncbi:Glutamate-gated chloride channel [Apis cerana cerana]|uniref:Glutamate-gated chloride channel n=1 Tax=Apis cerana cerana TaxID=94128 RepID=A0A2A3ECE4_APICC|nr:Glutamate-gated chloride channel [Apis cerana cerana]